MVSDAALSLSPDVAGTTSPTLCAVTQQTVVTAGLPSRRSAWPTCVTQDVLSHCRRELGCVTTPAQSRVFC